MNLEDWWYGAVGLSIPAIIVYVLVMTHVTIVGVTVYLHRFSAHRALSLHPVLQHFLRFWLWLTTGMITKEWTAVHRKHHTGADTPVDPHSPQLHGLRAVLLQGAEFYRAAATPETLERYGRGTPDDWMERNVYTPHTSLGVTLLLVVNVVLFGVLGLTVWAIQMLWIPFFAAGVVNDVGHRLGYRNFECPDAATNFMPWGILIGGEELHNNHHTYPNSAKLSVKWWEFDLGWAWIRLFQAAGLAEPLSTGPVVARVEGKTSIDMDTTWAVMNDRFRIMARYAEEVVAPLIKQECRRADAGTRRLLRRSKPVLCRHTTLVDERQRSRIEQVLDASPRLATIYEKRLELVAVWSKRGRGEDLLTAFAQWCSEAEATGIQVLSDFVEDLKSYTVPATARV